MDSPDQASAAGDDAILTSGSGRKPPRNRIRFSCTTCRDKKLKCNRELPCDQCLKRAIGSTCQYVPYMFPKAAARPSNSSNRPRITASEANLQNRLRHLERLVQVLKTQQREEADSGTPEGSPLVASTPHSFEVKAEQYDDSYSLDPGLSKRGSVSIEDKPGWEAMLDEIAELTDELRIAHDSPEDPTPDRSMLPEYKGPVLLLGTFVPATKCELVGGLPPKEAIDRMLPRFFRDQPAWSESSPIRPVQHWKGCVVTLLTTGLLLVIFHIPTFLSDYDSFWSNPSQASFTYIGLMYAVVAQTALIAEISDEVTMPGDLGSPVEVKNHFLARTAQCLTLDNYSKPGGKLKLETLILYAGIEYHGRLDATPSTSILFAGIIQSAMLSGYHRDPSNRKDMSVFEGEMRRRVWRLLVDVDCQIAFQFGVPPRIVPGTHDTELPRNIYDEEFDETSVELPPSRPLTEQTRMTYSILKERIETVWIDIQQSIYSTNPYSYDKVMELDHRLAENYESIPVEQRIRNFDKAPGDPVFTMVLVYDREFLYQKCRSVLHRRYLSVARADSRFAYSRWTCLDAAATTIRLQYDIHAESQPGGRLADNRYLKHSLIMHDALLAAMILCLELSYLLHTSKEDQSSGRAPSPPQGFTKDQLLEILGTSRKIWEKQCSLSIEAQRCFRLISRMLTVATGMEFDASPAASGSSGEFHDLQEPAAFQQAQSIGTASDVLNSMRGSHAMPTELRQPLSSTDVQQQWAGTSYHTNTRAHHGNAQPGAWVQSPAHGPMESVDLGSIDWTVWDNQIQSIGSEIPQIPWNAYFQHES